MAILKIKHILTEAAEEVCRNCMPDCLRIADLGCSCGPNALVQVEEIIKSIDKSRNNIDIIDEKILPCSIQIFLNDLHGNDFNTLSKPFPNFYTKLTDLKNWRLSSDSCFITAIPGSFYGRLFPSKSMHFIHSSNNLHWLSEVPKRLKSESGSPLNKGNIFIAKTSPRNVHEAYLNQFQKDLSLFLEKRRKEMVYKGHLVLIIVGKVADEDSYDAKELIGITIHDMVKEGLVKDEDLDSFDLLVYNPDAEEVEDIIKKEGSFKILQIQTLKSPWNDVYNADISKVNGDKGQYMSMFIRAVFESILASHFGEEIMDELLKRYAKRVSDYMKMGKGVINHVVVSLVKNEELELTN